MTSEELAPLVAELWRKGDLRWLLYPHQFVLLDHFHENHGRKEVWHASRRIGKSAAMLVAGLEIGIQKPGSIIRYGAATQKDVKEIIHPLMRILTETCPGDLKPVWRQSEGKYFFGNGSFMVVSGCDEGRADNLRGTSMDLGLLDEAGFIADLDYVVKGVLLPQCLTTDGRIILASTSPRSSSHPFVQHYLREAQEEGNYVKMTIYDDSRPEVKARIAEWQKEAGGSDSTTWKREYLCEIITDEESALVPEFSRPEVRARVIQKSEVPPYFIPYTVIDLGYIDHTAAVFGYVDFKRAWKVVLGELSINRKDSREIAAAIRAKEKEVWGTDQDGHCLRVPRRYADGQPLTLADFNSIHGLSVIRVSEDTVEAKVNELRLDISSGTLKIDPSCVKTAAQLHDGVWNKSHSGFDRSSAYGHFDLVSALTYFVRQANLRENPYPEDFGYNRHQMMVRPGAGQESKQIERALKDAFQLK